MMMEVEFTGRHTTVTPALKEQARAGLTRIEKVIWGATGAHVILSEEKYRKIAEVTVMARSCDLVARCESTVMETALHDALCKAEQQAIRHKKKVDTIRQHARPAMQQAVEPGAI
jgi:putative sigma-54 modulation protein